MVEREAKPKIKVCVIGAGAAGLCASRHLARESDMFEFEVFEKAGDIGGTWVYTDRIGIDDYGLPVHSSMYKNLRTNVPKELMKFPDYREIEGGEGSCVTHEVILNYLKCFADDFNLRQFIQFHTIVESVKLESRNPSSKWKVVARNVKTNKKRESIFDAIMICNGQFFESYIPSIPGLNNFSGKILHSHDYRKPEDFSNQTVIILGASFSGTDIALELAETASHVYLIHNKENCIFNNSVSKISEVPGIVGFENGRFLLQDDSKVEAEVLIFCTGYNYSYPFLDESCDISVEEKCINSLYMHIINIEHPTMCFIGIPMLVIPFIMFTVQVQYFLSTLKDPRRLPSKSEMLEYAKLMSANKKLAHVMTSNQQDYFDSLAQAGGFQPVPHFYQKAIKAWVDFKNSNNAEYKNYNLILKSGEDPLIVPNDK